MQQSDELKLAIEAAKKSGQIIKSGFGKVTDFKVKIGKGIVTEIDHTAEKVIIEILQSKFDYPILAEESGKIGEIKDSFWVIDPLDGTTNFSRGIPFFCTSIALIKNRKVVLGVTLYPITGDIYYAEKGKGAYVNGKRLHVSSRSDNDYLPVLNRGYGQDAELTFKKLVEKFNSFARMRRLGASALELCFVAKGSVDAFVDFGDELWDYAAGTLMVQEAGGKVTDWQGNDWTIENKYILATNSLIHDEVKNEIKDLQKTI